MSRHLLYLAFWFPPSRASGVYRALATTRQFVDSGWDVTVITTSREFLEDEIASVDETLLEEVPSQVEVVRVHFEFDIGFGRDVRSLGWWRANFPTLWKRLRKSARPRRQEVSAGPDERSHAQAITDNYAAWIDPVVRAGLDVHAARRVDHVLATGNPYSSFEAARLIATTVGTGYSIDYRDPWTIDVFTGRRNNADRLTTDAERRIVEDAEFCFHVNPAIADAYREKFPGSSDKHVVALNGYDPESIPPPSGPTKGPIRFGILGTMNSNWPTKAIFKAWSAVRDELPDGSEMVLGGHLGYFAKSSDVLKAALPDESTAFRYIGPVTKTSLADFYASVDVVVLPVPGGPMVTSGKVFEALALGKPIVCVQRRDGGARSMLDGRPLVFGAEPTARSVRAAIRSAADAARDLDPKTSRGIQAGAAEYERSRTISEVVKAISARTREPAS